MNEPNFNTEDNNLRFIVESALAKQEKANTRIWIVCLSLIGALLISIFLLANTYNKWIAYMDSFETTTTTTQTIRQETEDGGNYIGNFVGGDNNGEVQTDSDNNDN